MHPIILFNARVPGELDKAKAAGEEAILAHCIDCGGSITGEHGVGMEKNEMMDRLFSKDTLSEIQAFKDLFDPDNRLNPGKVLPTGKGCLEIRHTGRIALLMPEPDHGLRREALRHNVPVGYRRGS